MRKTLLLLIIAIALAAYVYFYEIKGGEKREKQKEVAEKIMHFKKDSINNIEINSYKGKFKFTKGIDGWQIDQPIEARADDSPINSLLSSLSNAKKVRTFNIKADEKNKFGLSFRALKIEVTEKNGHKEFLFLGDKTNIGSNVYASNVDTVVHLVSESLKNNADKSLFDWRDKKVIYLDKDKVREFSLKNPKGSYTFKKDGKDWKIVKPVATKADNSSVNAVLNKLDWGRIKSVIAEDNKNRAKYGLNRPAYKVKLFSGAEKAKTAVAFSKLNDNIAYGNDDARPHIFAVDSIFIKPFKKDLFDFRDKSIVHFDKDNVDRINLLYDGNLMKLSKDTSSTWLLSTGEKAKSWKINSILSTLKNLKTEKYVEEEPKYLMPYGLVNPEGRIEVFAGDDQLAELNIGYKKDGFVYVRNPRTKPVVTIKDIKLNDLFPAKKDVLEEVETEKENTDK